MSSAGSSISIVIPTYNRERWLGPTLDSVFGLKVPAGVSVEVLVIDNNCTDGTAAVVADKAKMSPWPLRHIIETQQGLCFGRNRGLQESKSEHVVYLDDDVVVAQDWLVAYLEAVEQLGADCVVGPVTPHFEGEVPWFLSGQVFDSIASTYSRKGGERKVLSPDVSHEVPGCNFGIRRSVGEEIGGFNPRLDRCGKALLAGGDFEFGHRLVAAGKRVVYEPRCAIQHVIVAEKLTQDYLRRRWFGAGRTARAVEPTPRPFAKRLRFALRAARLYVRSRTMPDGYDRFLDELLALQWMGYLTGGSTRRRVRAIRADARQRDSFSTLSSN